MQIVNEGLSDFGIRNITKYATEVNLDRAVPELYDGLKPVLRRVAWSASHYKSGEAVKSAKIIGTCIGTYHPHGDAATYGAMQTIVHHNIPLLEGIGGWGSLLDEAAAYRYCFVGSTRVNTEFGLLTFNELARRSNINGQDHVPFKIKVDTKHKPEYTNYFVDSGIQDVVRVTTVDGYSTVCTPNEPFYVIRENGFRWVKASDLCDTDYVCMKRGTQLKVKGSHKIDFKVAKFLGYMVGDGYMNKGQYSLGFNQVDNAIFNDFIECASIALSDYKDSFIITKQQPRSYGKQEYNQWTLNSAEARRKLKRLGLVEGNSYDQKVPTCVFRGSTEFMASFLRGLFEADGSVGNTEGQSSTISLNSVSIRLLEEVQLILHSQFGIFGRICTDGYERDNYKLYITGAVNIDKFINQIGLDYKGELIVNAEALKGLSTAGTSTDCIPFAKELHFGRWSRIRFANFKRQVEANILTSKAAKLIYERDYYYSRVQSVEDAGEEQVWDLTVPKSHSFVADGFVVHNTNARLSKFGQDIFDSKYLAVTNMVPNYDNTAKEPVVLPVKLPLLILNGADGIGVGITCSIPTFTVISVVNVLKELLSGKKLKYMDYAKMLRPKQHWGGQIVKTRENYQEWVNLMKTGKASIAFQSHVKVDDVKKEILVVDWPAGLNPLKFVDKVRALPECSRAYNTMGLEYRVEFKRGGTRQQFVEFVEKVKRLLVAKANYKFNVTHRIAKTENGITSYTTEFLSLNIPQFFERWVQLRVQLEKNCLQKQIENQQDVIAYSRLLIFASDHLDIIFKALRNVDSCSYLVKYLKISEKEANQILDLKVRTLSKLDQTELKAKLKEQLNVLKDLKYKFSHPRETIVNDLSNILNLIELDKKTRDKKLEQELKVL